MKFFILIVMTYLVKSEKILDEPTKTEPMDDGIDDSRELDEFEQVQ